MHFRFPQASSTQESQQFEPPLSNAFMHTRTPAHTSAISLIYYEYQTHQPPQHHLTPPYPMPSHVISPPPPSPAHARQHNGRPSASRHFDFVRPATMRARFTFYAIVGLPSPLPSARQRNMMMGYPFGGGNTEKKKKKRFAIYGSGFNDV